jgi:hypothetical protein
VSDASPAHSENIRPVGGQTLPPQVVEEKSFDTAPSISVKPGLRRNSSRYVKAKGNLYKFNAPVGSAFWFAPRGLAELRHKE